MLPSPEVRDNARRSSRKRRSPGEWWRGLPELHGFQSRRVAVFSSTAASVSHTMEQLTGRNGETPSLPCQLSQNEGQERGIENQYQIDATQIIINDVREKPNVERPSHCNHTLENEKRNASFSNPPLPEHPEETLCQTDSIPERTLGEEKNGAHLKVQENVQEDLVDCENPEDQGADHVTESVRKDMNRDRNNTQDKQETTIREQCMEKEMDIEANVASYDSNGKKCMRNCHDIDANSNYNEGESICKEKYITQDTVQEGPMPFESPEDEIGEQGVSNVHQGKNRDGNDPFHEEQDTIREQDIENTNLKLKVSTARCGTTATCTTGGASGEKGTHTCHDIFATSNIYSDNISDDNTWSLNKPNQRYTRDPHTTFYGTPVKERLPFRRLQFENLPDGHDPRFIHHAPRKQRKQPYPILKSQDSSQLNDENNDIINKDINLALNICQSCNAEKCSCTRPSKSLSQAISLKDVNQQFIVSKRAKLQYKSVPSTSGHVKVAIGLSLHSSLMGEIILSPFSTTRSRLALTSDEFYAINKGYVECDIDSRRIRLCSGDYLAIPQGITFEIRNPSPFPSTIIFFSPAKQEN